MIDRTLARFICVGIGNTLIGLGVIFAAQAYTTAFRANLIGYLLVVPVSFMTHRGWSFRDRGRLIPTFLRYLPTVAIGYVANLAVLRAGLAMTIEEHIVQTVAIGVYVVVTYLLSRYVVFLQPR